MKTDADRVKKASSLSEVARRRPLAAPLKRAASRLPSSRGRFTAPCDGDGRPLGVMTRERPQVSRPLYTFLTNLWNRDAADSFTRLTEDAMVAKRILIIETEPHLHEVIQSHLAQHGYWVSVVRDLKRGFRRVQDEAPDLVILDLTHQAAQGLELCQKLKTDPLTRAVPLIVASGNGDESAAVAGLEYGAEDSIRKPFRPQELLARILAVLRRNNPSGSGQAPSRIVRGPVEIDAEVHRVLIDGRSVSFTATEFRLLHFLASRAGAVFRRDQLLEEISVRSRPIGDRTIDVYIKILRKKLGKHRRLIETVRGVGYRFQDTR
jgi:two-component system phosphate regulon response regulator PhoB